MNRSNLRLCFAAGLAALLAVSGICAQPLTKPNETLALTNVTVIDGNGGRPMPNMTVVISGGRIADMFATGKKRPPAGATVMNMRGHYLIPGLIDSHCHFTIGMRRAMAMREGLLSCERKQVDDFTRIF